MRVFGNTLPSPGPYKTALSLDYLSKMQSLWTVTTRTFLPTPHAHNYFWLQTCLQISKPNAHGTKWEFKKSFIDDFQIHTLCSEQICCV